MGDIKKEATILSLTQSLLMRQGRLRSDLYNLIDRTRPDAKEAEAGKPMNANVLDEIIQNLEEAVRNEEWAVDTVASDIAAKIQ